MEDTVLTFRSRRITKSLAQTLEQNFLLTRFLSLDPIPKKEFIQALHQSLLVFEYCDNAECAHGEKGHWREPWGGFLNHGDVKEFRPAETRYVYPFVFVCFVIMSVNDQSDTDKIQTFDIQRRCIATGFEDPTKKDRDICDIYPSEYWIILFSAR
jgi:hypothetical protein